MTFAASGLARIARLAVPERFRPIGYLTYLTQRRTGQRIAAGAFKGVKYVDRSFGSAYIPKLLGLYERELGTAVADIVHRRPRRVIDVGAAEGYYAVGLARLLPDTEVIAFEGEERGRQLLQQMIAVNDVGSRVEVRGWCGPNDLNEALVANDCTVVLMDAEGAEADLIDLNRVPRLRSAELLIETHDFIVPGVTEQLIGRLRATHRITTIHQTGRKVEDYPYSTLYTSLLPKRYIEWAVSEWRPVPMTWLHCTPLPPGQ